MPRFGVRRRGFDGQSREDGGVGFGAGWAAASVARRYRRTATPQGGVQRRISQTASKSDYSSKSLAISGGKKKSVAISCWGTEPQHLGRHLFDGLPRESWSPRLPVPWHWHRFVPRSAGHHHRAHPSAAPCSSGTIALSSLSRGSQVWLCTGECTPG